MSFIIIYFNLNPFYLLFLTHFYAEYISSSKFDDDQKYSVKLLLLFPRFLSENLLNYPFIRFLLHQIDFIVDQTLKLSE